MNTSKAILIAFLFSSIGIFVSCAGEGDKAMANPTMDVESVAPMAAEQATATPDTEAESTAPLAEAFSPNSDKQESKAPQTTTKMQQSKNRTVKVNQAPPSPSSAPAMVVAPPAPSQALTVKPPPVAEKPAQVAAATNNQAATIDHAAWDALLRKYVSSTGSVNYSGFKSDKASLQAYLDDLAKQTPQSDWSRKEAMAYWINAYNAFTVKKIVDNYPLKSITDLDGGKPWDVKWIKLGTKTYSLNQIENDILRPNYKDARIHFAVNCAAKSCPPLLNRAFLPATLEAQLASQTKKFINNSKYTSIEPTKASVSKIFEWYASDFGDLKAFLNTYSDTDLESSATIDYMDYNWKLND